MEVRFAGVSEQPSNTIGPPFQGLRPVGGSYTFGGRQGRMSPTRQRAFEQLVPRFAAYPPFAETRLVVEIGCGKGDATAAMAPGEPNSLVIACEPNSATIASLAQLLDERQITNVRLWNGDAFDLLAQLGDQSVAEIRIWFPDPWPKPRHAGKRLITAARLSLITDAMTIGAALRLATDDADYAQAALLAISVDPRLEGGVVSRPPERPITVFEARGLREGRATVDLHATRCS